MADKKITELNNATLPLTGTEEVPIVQNGETKKVNASEFIVDTSEFVKESELSNVATSGDYDDLNNKPTIPNANDFVDKSGDQMTGLLQTPTVQERSFKRSNTLTGVYNVDWSLCTNHDITMSENTIITQSNIVSVGFAQTITIYVKGDYALTLPTEWVVIGGVYDPNGTQFIVQSWDDGNFYCAIGGGEIDLSNYLQKSGGSITGNLNVSGNVGIGTTNPSQLFEVNGKIASFSTSQTYVFCGTNIENHSRISFDGDFGLIQSFKSNSPVPLKVNDKLIIGDVPVFADNTSASSLETGTIYRTSDGTLKIKY